MKFANGVYFGDKNMFAKHDPLISPEHVELYQHEKVKPFDLSLLKYGPEDWNIVDVKPLDDLFLKQNLDVGTTLWIYGLIGRMFRRQCTLDNWGNIVVLNFGAIMNTVVMTYSRFHYFDAYGARLICPKMFTNEFARISNSTTWRGRIHHDDTMTTTVNPDECIAIHYPVPLNPLYCLRSREELRECVDRLVVKCNLAYLYLVQKYGSETNLYNVLPEYFKQTREMVDFQELPQTYQ